jgi:hypothetical protein
MHVKSRDQNELQDRKDDQQRNQPNLQGGRVKHADLHRREYHKYDRDEQINGRAWMRMFVGEGMVVRVVTVSVTVFNGVIAHA